MLVVTFVCFIALLLSFLSSKGIVKQGLEMTFILIFAVFSVRYDYGNDYMEYYALFKDIANSCNSFNDLISYYDSETVAFSEIGWGILNYLFKPLGFFVLVAFLTAFEFYVYYFIIKTYVPRFCQWLAVFIFLFNPELMILQLSMMRQALAIVLLIVATHFMIRERIIFSLLCMFCASFIHKSAIFVAPVFLVGLFYKKMGKLSALIIVALYILILYLFDKFSIWLFEFMNEDVIGSYARYESRVESSEMHIGLGYIVASIPFVLLLKELWAGNRDKRTSYIMFLAAFGLALSPIVYVYSMLNRFVFYFSVFTIIGIPIVYYNIYEKSIRYLLIAFFALMSLWNFFSFFSNSTWNQAFSVYHTIL